MGPSSAPPAKQRMPWEPEAGHAKGSVPAGLSSAPPTKQRMPWESEPGHAKGSVPAGPSSPPPAKQRTPWESDPRHAKGSGAAAPSTELAPTKQLPWQPHQPEAKGSAFGVTKSSQASAKQPVPRELEPKRAIGPAKQLTVSKGQGGFARQVAGSGRKGEAQVLRFDDLDWGSSGYIRKEDFMNVLLAYQTQQITIEMPNVHMESARAKAEGAQIWGEGAGPGVLAQGKAKAKGGWKGAMDFDRGERGQEYHVEEKQYGACVHCHTHFTDDSIYCRRCGVKRLEKALDWDEVDEVSESKDPSDVHWEPAKADQTKIHPEVPGLERAQLPQLPSGPPISKQQMPPMPPPPALRGGLVQASKDAEASREREPEEKVLEEKFPWKAEATIPKAVSPAVPKTAVKEGPKTAAKMISKAAPKAVPKATTISAKKSESQVKPGMKEQNKADEVPFSCPVTDPEGGEVGVAIRNAITVSELKAVISKEMSINEKDFRVVLSLDGQRRILQDNNEFLDVNLLRRAGLTVEQPVDIDVVGIDGSHINVKADRSWSSSKLIEVVSDKAGFPEDQIVLKLGRNPLLSSDDLLGDVLPAGPKQELIATRPLDVIVSDDSGRRWVISADRSWKLQKVQQKLMEESGYAIEEQTLQHAKLSADGTLPNLDSEMELDNVLAEGPEVHMHLLVDYKRFMDRGVAEAREAEAQRRNQMLLENAPDFNVGPLRSLEHIAIEDRALLPWEGQDYRNQMWKYPPHSLDYTRLLDRAPQTIEFSALLADPPWREPATTQGKQSPHAKDKDGQSGRVTSPHRPFSIQDRARQSTTMPLEKGFVEISKDLDDSEQLSSKSEESQEEFEEQPGHEESGGSQGSIERFQFKRSHGSEESQEEGQEKDKFLEESFGRESSENLSEAGQEQNASTGVCKGKASDTGGSTHCMTSSLVQWGGFQHLRQSVAPGAGTIIFVNPADHPGVGTAGGSRSAAQRVLRRQRVQDVRAGHTETWQPVASSNSLQPHIRHKVLEELRRTETEAPQFGDSCGDDVDVGDSSPAPKFTFYVNDLQAPPVHSTSQEVRSNPVPFWPCRKQGAGGKPMLLPASAPWGAFAVQVSGHVEEDARG